MIDYKKTIMNPRWYIENMLKIVDKNGKLVNFVLNDEQSKMLDHIEFCLENDIPIRMIVLKARQIGSTTFFSALGYWLASTRINTTYGIVAHRFDSAESIFGKCKVYYNNLEKAFKPSTTQMSGDGITFDKKDGKGINSKIKFATVNDGVFRGQTLTYLHLTECAFWEGNVQAIENSLSPTIANVAGTIIVRESTANGYNFFKDDWDRAVKGESNYKPFFFGWQDHKEYKLTPPNGYAETMSRKEKEMMEKYKLSLEQMFWRRYTIDNDYKGNEEWFKQEYPMTPEEAFVTSGSSVFDGEVIIDGYDGCIEPKEIDVVSYPTFEKIMIWEEPIKKVENIYQMEKKFDEESQRYVDVETDLVIEERYYEMGYTIGIDTSGLGADKNQIVVIKNETKEMVARYEKKNLNEQYLAMIAVEMAKYYNDALIVPEVNYSHEITKYIMDDDHCGYKNVFINENITREDQKISGIIYGWKTTSKTKPQMISYMRSVVSENPRLVKDRGFWYEAEYFIIEDTQKSIMNAQSGKHDDIIIATSIAMYASNSMQAKQGKIYKKQVYDENELLLNDYLHKKTNIRKGIYKNNA